MKLTTLRTPKDYRVLPRVRMVNSYSGLGPTILHLWVLQTRRTFLGIPCGWRDGIEFSDLSKLQEAMDHLTLKNTRTNLSDHR